MNRPALPLIPLHDAGAAPRAEVGGKALRLGRLAAVGLTVPPGFVVPASAYREASGRQALPDGWADALIAAARGLGGPLAVRSSGVEEDGAQRSWAGQYETVLGVSAEGVPDAVRRVWASARGPAALAYGGAPGGAVAVLVQRMVEPAVAGVMFTVDPASATGREMVVEAVWGLGDALLAGEVAPHWYRVRRPGRLPRGVWRLDARARLDVVQEGLPALAERRVLRGGAVVKEVLPEALAGEPTLSPRALLRLCRLGLRVERLFGAPQDVEWAIDARGAVHLLQARPITTPRPRPAPEALWSRRFLGERWPEPATPLGWSIVGPLLEEIVAFPDVQRRHLGGAPTIRLVHGRPYVNTAIFRRLGFKLPGGAPPRFVAELLPPEEEAAWRTRPVVLPDVAVLADLLRSAVRDRRWERLRCNPLTNDREWEAFRARLERELPNLSREPRSGPEAVGLVEQQIERVREYVAIHVCSLLFAHVAYQVLESLLTSWAPSQASSWMERLATCPEGNLTLETNAALRRLARAASEADLARLEVGGAEGPFAEALSAFLASYGHRSASSWEICAPRWATEPRRLVPLLRAQRAGSEDPADRAARQQAAFEDALGEVRACFGRSRRGRTLELLIPYLRRYLLLRENQRFWFDRLLYAMQRTVWQIGEDLVERGLVDRREDVAFLEWPELRALAEGGTGAVRSRIAERRARWEEDARTEPPIFLTGEDAVSPPGGSRLQGLGISPGRARGRVRVLRSVEDGAAVRPGEILVARAVDPGWTPLLADAAGLVLELGGVLSHGAVVAREYGLPAVVNLEGVTRRLRDGDEVTVDGSRGIVWLHGDPQP